MIDSRKLVYWYDVQAPFYRLWRNRYGGALASAVVEEVRSLPRHGRMLDAGCGTGLFGVVLAGAFPDSRVMGVDLSQGMLRVAEREVRRFSLTNLVLSRADARRLPLPPDAFDAVIAAGLFPNLNEPLPVLRELSRVLAPDGRLIVAEFDRDSMNLASRLIFRAMILGYRSVSMVFRRFRFSESWDLRASTIERARFERDVTAAGLQTESVHTRNNHLIYRLARRPPP